MSTRTGSAILLCLGLSTIAVLVAYAFLRAATRDDSAGRISMMMALARDAAQSGQAHATEQILADYLAGTLEIVDQSGPRNHVSPPTFLDGPWRAPFVSFGKPNRLAGTQTGDPSEADDVQEENNLIMPFHRKSSSDGPGWHGLGCETWDGRGRYVEVNWRNATRPTQTVADPKPVEPVRFSVAAAAAPELNEALFLDQDLRRLTTGTATEQRRDARYRLRYAVGVIDLQGHLLSNPLADMDTDWSKPDNDYRGFEQIDPATGTPTITAPALCQPRRPWLESAAQAWYNMTNCYMGRMSAPLRLAEIFRGRGHSGNCDRSPLAGRLGVPAAFPMMYRRAPSDGYSMYMVSGRENLDGRLYSSKANRWWYLDIPPTPAGLQILTPTEWEEMPYVHAMLGPQASWYTQYFALMGSVALGDGPDAPYHAQWAVRRGEMLTVPTPFGRRQEATTAAKTDWKWYHGRADTPWRVNPLTAPPQIISQMLLAIAPPHLKTLHYTTDYYYPKTGVTIEGYDIYSATSTKTGTNGGAGWDVAVPSRDVVTDLAAAGLGEFPAPTASYAGVVAKPDYGQDARETRPESQRYPGALVRGADAAADDLGKEIDVDSAPLGRCTHTGNPLLYLFGGNLEYIVEATATEPKYRVRRIIDPAKFTYQYSYWWDLIKAMTTTLSYSRATWVQYPNTVFDPRPGSASVTEPGFTPYTLRDPVDSLEKLDRLLLRQLGEDFDSPGSRLGVNPIRLNQYGSSRYNFGIAPGPVSRTIAELRSLDLLKKDITYWSSSTIADPPVKVYTTISATSDERAAVMERMLNDFRMSFLGASAEYSDDFRPLDFDGDGKVQCSCYDIDGGATAREKDLGIARRKPQVGAGRGPALTPLTLVAPYSRVSTSPWFSVTGCFAFGKSRFFRVFTRGELFDNWLGKPVAAQTLERVLAVDPEAPRVQPAGRPPAQTRVLYQRWHYNDTTSELPRQLR